MKTFLRSLASQGLIMPNKNEYDCPKSSTVSSNYFLNQMTESNDDSKPFFPVFPRFLQQRNESGFVIQNASLHLSPGSRAILVIHAYHVVDYSVNFLPVLGSNLYACFFKNIPKMSEVTCHTNSHSLIARTYL
jgi:hypothetical protein